MHTQPDPTLYVPAPAAIAVRAGRRRHAHRVFPTAPGNVPISVARRVVRTLLARNQFNYQQISELSGVSPRLLHRLFCDPYAHSISWHAIDALLAACDAVDLWHEPPLAQFFEPPSTSGWLNPRTEYQVADRSGDGTASAA